MWGTNNDSSTENPPGASMKKMIIFIHVIKKANKNDFMIESV